MVAIKPAFLSTLPLAFPVAEAILSCRTSTSKLKRFTLHIYNSQLFINIRNHLSFNLTYRKLMNEQKHCERKCRNFNFI